MADDPIAEAKQLLEDAGYLVIKASDYSPRRAQRVAEAWRVAPPRLTEALELVRAAGYTATATVRA